MRAIRRSAWVGVLLLGVGCGLFKHQQPKLVTPLVQVVAGNQAQVVAQAEGISLTWQDVMQGNASAVAELNERVRQAIQEAVDRRLVAAAAKQAGKSEDAFLQEAVPMPTEGELRALFDQVKGRQGWPEEAFNDPGLQEKLGEHLLAQKKGVFFASLRKQHPVRITVPVHRLTGVQAVGPARGPENAPVTMVVFSDYQCPFCSRAEAVVTDLVKKYPTELRVVFRDLPLDFHDRAIPAAEAALCANEQGKFWEMHDHLFAHQKELSDSNLEAAAKTVGVADMKKFKSCVAEHRMRSEIDRSKKEANDMGLGGTPAFLINGIPVTGAQPFEVFDAVIQQELGR